MINFIPLKLFAILQKYEFSSKSQPNARKVSSPPSCLRYCKSTSFQANHNNLANCIGIHWLFAILQKYEFSSKSQPEQRARGENVVVCDTAKVRVFKQITTLPSKSPLTFCCLRYCKSTSFQANHNRNSQYSQNLRLFAILQKYEFSSKSQQCT